MVGRAASRAAWTVPYCLPGPTSASRGLVAEFAEVAGESTWRVRVLTLFSPPVPARVIPIGWAPVATAAGTVSLIWESLHEVGTTVVLPTLSAPVADPKPRPVMVTVRSAAVPFCRT